MRKNLVANKQKLKSYFLTSEFKENFLSRDERVHFINKNNHLRPEGRVVSIVESPARKKALIVSAIQENNVIFGIPIDDQLTKVIFANKPQVIKDKRNFFLVVITGWNFTYNVPIVEVKDILGDSNNPKMEAQIVLQANKIDYDEFSEEIMSSIEPFHNWTPTTEDRTTREDLRSLLVFTVDPEGSKDLDDALSLQKVNERDGKSIYEVAVHIADPTHFLEKLPEMAEEAKNRITTIYLVDRNIPMLPRTFSENLCSLLPGVDRLAISCIFHIDEYGQLDEFFEPRFTNSIVTSRLQLTYDEAFKLIEGRMINTKNKFVLSEISSRVKILNSIARRLKAQREISGSLSVRDEKHYYELDETGFPKGIKEVVKHEAHSMIEEFMLLANKLAAQFSMKHYKQTTLLRTHFLYNDAKYTDIVRYFKANGLEMIDKTNLVKSLEYVKQIDEFKYNCLKQKTKYFLLRADYAFSGDTPSESLKHEALAFDLYTHFTSPIRRFPDVIVHKAIKSILKGITEDEFIKKLQNEGLTGIIERMNEKIVNQKQINRTLDNVYMGLLLRENPLMNTEMYVIDICSRTNKMKKVFECMHLYVPALKMTVEWVPEDQSNVSKIEFDIENARCEFTTNQKETLKLFTFDKVIGNLKFKDTVPVDVKVEIISKI